MNMKKWLLYGGILLISFVAIYLFIFLFPIIKIVVSFILQLLVPFLIAGFIAYLLYPVILFLQQWNVGKISALFIIFIILIGFILFIGYRGLPVLYEEIQDFSLYLPELIDVYEQIIYSIYESTAFLPEAVHRQLDLLIIEIEIELEQQIEQILHQFMHLFDYFFTIIMIPVILFYLLKDYVVIKNYFIATVPNRYERKTVQLLHAIHVGLGNYLRGQFIVSTAVFILTYIVYHLLGLKYAFALSVFTGIMNIVPYFGPIIGMIPALIIAFAHSTYLVLFVIATTLLIQIVEGVFLSPYIMGKSVRLHPLVIIFVILCSAKLGGFIWMLIAIPLVTIARAVLIEFLPRTAMR